MIYMPEHPQGITVARIKRKPKTGFPVACVTWPAILHVACGLEVKQKKEEKKILTTYPP
jgi:hypothetical protein